MIDSLIMTPSILRVLLLSVPLASASFAQSEAATIHVDHEKDWPWWRGPSRDNVGLASAEAPPLKFSDEENVIWKSKVPGRGHASPTVVGSRIFLATAHDGDQTQSVVAFDRKTGAELWKREVHRGKFPAKIHGKNTHASATVASDGVRVFASFYNSDAVHVVALTVSGEPVWERLLGPFKPKKYEFGYAASPLLYGELVVVVADQVNEGFLTALDRKTGEVRWKTKRPDDINYASPTLASFGGQDKILVGGIERIRAYSPEDGKLIWESDVATAPQTCGTVVWDGDLVFASGGYPNKLTSAVRVPSGEVVWSNQKKCYEQSMLAHDGYVYALNDNGIAYCWRAKDGEEMWSERLKGPVSASPVLVGDRIYAVNERGAHYVFRADPKTFELLATNELGDETFATPTIIGSRIYTRVAEVDDDGGRQEWLYCLGE